MMIDSARLVCFSPTGTTKRVLEGIVAGLQPASVDLLDLTWPDKEGKLSARIGGGLALIGSPVYGGRVPVDVAARLSALKGEDAPAVVVVVYGNRAYEDALLELRDLAVKAGFRPFVAAAFIGEHSYSTTNNSVCAKLAGFRGGLFGDV